MIRLVVFDADGTLWEHSDISSLSPPFSKIDENTLIDRKGVEIRLFPDVKRLLNELTTREIIVSMASWNKPEPVFEALRKLDILHYFTHPKVEFHPNKHEMMKGLLTDLEAEGTAVKPEEILYIDDQTWHIEKIRKHIGAIHFLQFGVDITAIIDVLKFL